ncbi:hypothetical protein Bpfe_003738, partial [Biomphalaria pfeifferi]
NSLDIMLLNLAPRQPCPTSTLPHVNLAPRQPCPTSTLPHANLAPRQPCSKTQN